MRKFWVFRIGSRNTIFFREKHFLKYHEKGYFWSKVVRRAILESQVLNPLESTVHNCVFSYFCFYAVLRLCFFFVVVVLF